MTFRDRIGKLGDLAFWLWAVVGIGFGFGISAFGVFTIPASLLVTILLLTQPKLRHSVYGVLVGIGAVLLLVAYINREGPGTVCHTFSNGFECAHDLPDPKKWAGIGLAFVLAGLLAQMYATGRPLLSRSGRF